MINNDIETIEKVVVKLNEETFSKEVEDLVWEKDISYLDAITEISIDRDIEFENVKKLLTPAILIRLEIEAEELSLLKTKENRLKF